MTTVRHLFVYVVDRPEDPFLGFKHLLSQHRQGRHIIHEIKLPPESLKIVRQVEYSARKYVRFLYYRAVFQQLEGSLKRALRKCGPEDLSVIYFSDEGVWSEFLRIFRSRYSDLNIFAVNVQHGCEYHYRHKYGNLRRTVNWLARRLWGYPLFGMGSYGGAGSGVFDVYLAYDETTCKLIRERTHALVYVCPSVIKHGLIERYETAKALLEDGGAGSRQRILFALQPAVPRILGPATTSSNLLSVFRELTSVAKLLVQKHEKRMVFRIHPGMDQEEVMEIYRQSGIDRYADIEEVSELGDHLSSCNVVMSYDSTVLWEAYILGLVPVSVQGKCHRGNLPFPHEIIDVTSNLDAHLERVLRPEVAEKYRCRIGRETFDWGRVITDLIDKIAAAEEADDNQPTLIKQSV